MQSRSKRTLVCLLTVLICGIVTYGAVVIGIYNPLKLMIQSETVEGTVRARALETEPAAPSGTNYVPVVTYRYSYDGTSFTNDNLRPGVMEAYESDTEARAVLDRYPPGKEVTVYVRPEAPSKSFLIMSWPGYWVWAMAVTSFLLTLAGAKGLVDATGGVDPPTDA